MTAAVRHPPRHVHLLARLPDFAPADAKLPCRDVDPDLFFPLPNDPGDEARAVCHTCPFEVECGEWATAADVRDGIFGALDPKERAAIRKQAKLGADKAGHPGISTSRWASP